MLVTPSHIYRKYHISTHFLDKNHLLSFSAQRKNIIFSGKINTIFPDITKKIVFRREFPGKAIFPEHRKKIWYFQVFFWEKSSFFLCLRIRLYFREKEILSFLIIQERSYSSAIYLERPCFQNIWKKKIWFFVQCMGLLFLLVWPVILVDFGNRTILLSKPFPTISFPLRSVKLGYLWRLNFLLSC